MTPDLWGRDTKIKVAPAVQKPLNDLVRSALDIHQASFNQQDQQFKTAVLSTLQMVEQARSQTHNLSQSVEAAENAPVNKYGRRRGVLSREQRHHLIVMLDAIRDHLNRARNSLGMERKESLQEAFRQIVQVAQVYDLDDYNIFFCRSDRSIWVQSGTKAQNPIDPERYGSCGMRVRK